LDNNTFTGTLPAPFYSLNPVSSPADSPAASPVF